MSSLLITAAFSCLFKSGMLKTKQSPKFVKHNKSTSECIILLSKEHEKFAKAILLTLAPEKRDLEKNDNLSQNTE